MKKTLLLLIALALFSSPLLAVEPATEDAELVETQSSTGQLVNLDLSQAMNRINNLERDIDDLERTNRYQDERIRSVERSINDLRRDVR